MYIFKYKKRVFLNKVKIEVFCTEDFKIPLDIIEKNLIRTLNYFLLTTILKQCL